MGTGTRPARVELGAIYEKLSPFALSLFGSSHSGCNVTDKPPLMEASINAKPARFFLDSGSSLSLISTKTLKEFHLTTAIHPTNIRIMGVTGNMSVVGNTWIPMSFGGSNIYHRFTVVNSPNYPGNCLLGHPFMVEMSLWLHPASNAVYYQGRKIPLTPHSPAWGSHHHLQASTSPTNPACNYFSDLTPPYPPVNPPNPTTPNDPFLTTLVTRHPSPQHPYPTPLPLTHTHVNSISRKVCIT